MHQWFQDLPNSLLMQAEYAQLEKILPTYLGEYLLQIGGPSEFSLISPIRYKFYLTHDSQLLSRKTYEIVGNCLQLPIFPQTVHVLLLVHILEFLKQPMEILQEIYQTLAPCGHLIILGFNSLSLWGLTHLWKKLPAKPWKGHFYTSWQVKHWLRTAGFQIVNSETFFFRPPFTHKNWDKHFLWLEAAGQLCLPGCGSVYIINAQKREEGMTPIKLKPKGIKLVLNNHLVKQPSSTISLQKLDN